MAFILKARIMLELAKPIALDRLGYQRPRVADLTSLTPRGSRQPREQLEAMAHQDPIDRMRRQLLETLVLDDATDDQIQRDCISVVEAAVEQARSSPSPEPALALDNVFQGER